MVSKIEPYSDKYLLDVVKILKNFHTEAVHEYDGLFDPDTIIKTIQSTNPDNAFLLIIDDVCQGVLYGVVMKSSFNDRYMFQEIIWYVNPKYRRWGVRLLKVTEKLLKERGISIMIMAALENSKSEKLREFYKRLGYKPMETNYMRVL